MSGFSRTSGLRPRPNPGIRLKADTAAAHSPRTPGDVVREPDVRLQPDVRVAPLATPASA